MATKYTADSIVVITNDRDRVRQSPNMYIPNKSTEGHVHCCFEIFDNSVDEVSIPDTVGNKIDVTFDNKTKEFSVRDNGRGIPQEKLFDVLTVLAASGKFNNGEESAYKTSGGVYGHGSTVVLALSKSFECTSTRDGKALTYIFKDGLKESEKKESAKGHGTYTKFILDPTFVDGKAVTDKILRERIEEKSYVFPNIDISFTTINNGKVDKTYRYGGKSLSDRVKKWHPSTHILEYQGTRKVTSLKNIDDESLTVDYIDVNLAFAFSEEMLDHEIDEYMISYANTIKTYAGGAHVDGVRLGVQKYFKDKVIPKLKGKDKDLQIMPTDMISGLCLFVAVALTKPEYRGQEKTQLSNQEVKFAVRDAVYETLCDAKSSDVNPMIDFVKRVARGRMASKKTRKKDVSNAFSKDRLEKFKDVVYNLNTTSPELILAEGDSACDNAASARDPYNQAIYGIRRPKNIFDTPTEQVARIKSTFNDVLDICGIEPGKKCDPEKSTMNHILMLTDGDIDGDDIAISTICLLAKHCKPLIDAGMVGRILPPAYAIPMGNGKYSYVRSQREFFDKITKMFIKTATVSYKGTELSKKELRSFIEKNFEYDTRLEKLANRYCVDPNVMEYIAWNYHGELKDQKKSYWMKILKRYPGVQILIEDNMLVFDGDIKGSDYMNLALDDHFHKHVMRFKEYQKKNSTIEGYSLNKDDGLTVYDVMRHLRKVMPSGIKRFKGLGELEPEEMRSLCMDKESRTVIIFKFSDFEKDMDKINVIMSTKAEHARARKELMMSMRIDDLDLDT